MCSSKIVENNIKRDPDLVPNVIGNTSVQVRCQLQAVKTQNRGCNKIYK